MAIVFGIMGIAMPSVVGVAFAIVSLIPLIFYQISISKLKREANTKEW